MSMEDIDDDEFDPEAFEREGSTTPIDSPDPKSAAASAAAAPLEKGMPPKDKLKKKEEVGRAGPATKGYIALTKEQIETDWYAVLEAPNDATDVELKKAYQKKCLDTHPDKNPEHDDTAFKHVIKGYEVLGNPETRRSYDSSMKFDDSIPSDKAYSDAEFFKTFNKVFDRNRKWCTGNAPRLGDLEASDADLDKFYDFWFQFKSWRDFSHEVEPIDPSEYDESCREIRRRVQRENDKQVAVLKKAEAKRVMTLVERAHKLDPRIRARALREKEEKAAAADKRASDKAAAENKVIQDKKDAEEAEKKAVEDRKVANKAAQARRKEARLEVHALLQTRGVWDDTQGESMAIRADKVMRCTGEWMSAKSENLDALIAALTAAAPEALVALVNETVAAAEARLRLDRYGMPYKAPPPGTVAADQAQSTTATKTPDKTKSTDKWPVAEKKAVAPPVPVVVVAIPVVAKDDAGTWTEADLVALQKAVAKYPGGSVDRWNRMSEFMATGHTGKQILLKCKQVEGNWNVLKDVTTTDGGVTATAAATPEAWTPKQQKQFEDILRDLKDYKEKDKWDKIAEAVEGKKKSECVARYKYLASIQGK